MECEVGIDGIVKKANRNVNASGPLKLLYVGRVIRTKGLRDAVRSISKLPSDIQVTLTAAGAGEDLEACIQEARSLGVANKIKFLGKVERAEVEKLYQSHDVFLFPSFREPTGGVILEAMRYGLPVISTSVGGPGFLVTEDSGVVVAATNPDQMAIELSDAIAKLASDPEYRNHLAEGARKRVEEIGLWDNKLSRMLEYYKEISQK